MSAVIVKPKTISQLARERVARENAEYEAELKADRVAWESAGRPEDVAYPHYGRLAEERRWDEWRESGGRMRRLEKKIGRVRQQLAELEAELEAEAAVGL